MSQTNRGDSGNYIPIRPQILGSGKYKGFSLEEMMFRNYKFVNTLYLYSLHQNTSSPYAQHLRMLMESSNNLQIVDMCMDKSNELVEPCKNPVQYFGFSTSKDGQTSEICSMNTRCKEHADSLLYDNKWRVYPIKFSSILKFTNNYQEKELLELIKHVCGIKKFDAFSLFKFFFNSTLFPNLKSVKIEEQLNLL